MNSRQFTLRPTLSAAARASAALVAVGLTFVGMGVAQASQAAAQRAEAKAAQPATQYITLPRVEIVARRDAASQ